GEAEEARHAELTRRITDLQRESPAAALADLSSVKRDIAHIETKLEIGQSHFNRMNRAALQALIADLKDKNLAAAATGTESFRQPFFKAIGSPEWESFIRTARELAVKENDAYPAAGAHCLLCHQSLDDEAHNLLHRLWAFLDSGVQKAAAE